MSAQEKLRSFIATRDRRVSKAMGYECAPLAEHFEHLMAGQVVRVGGRASCGGNVDPTWLEFGAWKEIVRKARKEGIGISEVPVKNGNGWATKNRGFWDEKDYQLAISATTPDGQTSTRRGVRCDIYEE